MPVLIQNECVKPFKHETPSSFINHLSSENYSITHTLTQKWLQRSEIIPELNISVIYATIMLIKETNSKINWELCSMISLYELSSKLQCLCIFLFQLFRWCIYSVYCKTFPSTNYSIKTAPRVLQTQASTANTTGPLSQNITAAGVNQLFNWLATGGYNCHLELIIFSHIRDRYLGYSLQKWPQLNATEHLWWLVNIGSGNGLLPSGNKPFPGPILTQISVIMWRH